MPDEVTEERVAAIASAARIPIPSGAAARIAQAVGPNAARFAAIDLGMPFETEPSTFVVVQRRELSR